MIRSDIHSICDSENNQCLFILTDRQFILRSVGNGCPIWFPFAIVIMVFKCMFLIVLSKKLR